MNVDALPRLNIRFPTSLVYVSSTYYVPLTVQVSKNLEMNKIWSLPCEARSLTENIGPWIDPFLLPLQSMAAPFTLLRKSKNK